MARERTAGGASKEAVRVQDRLESEDMAANLEALSHLDEKGVRQRWRMLMGRPISLGLGRSLTLRILAYRQQAQRYGDLELATRKALAQAVTKQGQPDQRPGNAVTSGGAVEREVPAERRGTNAGRLLRPGTLLAREHAGVLHRVMVMDEGFGWNGKTYDSLSKVAFAITSTRWNGPRFFGLRDKIAEGKKNRAEKVAGQGSKVALSFANGSSASPDGRTFA
jgi:hypothetical protein